MGLIEGGDDGLGPERGSGTGLHAVDAARGGAEPDRAIGIDMHGAHLAERGKVADLADGFAVARVDGEAGAAADEEPAGVGACGDGGEGIGTIGGDEGGELPVVKPGEAEGMGEQEAVGPGEGFLRIARGAGDGLKPGGCLGGGGDELEQAAGRAEVEISLMTVEALAETLGHTLRLAEEGGALGLRDLKRTGERGGPERAIAIKGEVHDRALGEAGGFIEATDELAVGSGDENTGAICAGIPAAARARKGADEAGVAEGGFESGGDGLDLGVAESEETAGGIHTEERAGLGRIKAHHGRTGDERIAADLAEFRAVPAEERLVFKLEKKLAAGAEERARAGKRPDTEGAGLPADDLGIGGEPHGVGLDDAVPDAAELAVLGGKFFGERLEAPGAEGVAFGVAELVDAAEPGATAGVEGEAARAGGIRLQGGPRGAVVNVEERAGEEEEFAGGGVRQDAGDGGTALILAGFEGADQRRADLGIGRGGEGGADEKRERERDAAHAPRAVEREAGGAHGAGANGENGHP